MEPRGIEPRLSAFQTDAITILAQVPYSIYLLIGSTGGIRTHTELILSQVPPAFGLQCHLVERAGIEPAYENLIRVPDATSLPFARWANKIRQDVGLIIGQCNPIKHLALADTTGAAPAWSNSTGWCNC